MITGFAINFLLFFIETMVYGFFPPLVIVQMLDPYPAGPKGGENGLQ